MTHADVAERIRHTFTRHDVVRGDEIALQRVEIAHVEAPVMRKMFGRGAPDRPHRYRRQRGCWWGTPLALVALLSRRAQRAINARHGFRFSQ